MLRRARNKFISHIKSEFIDLDNMKEIKLKIEEMGYNTSRIYGHKNVKRLTSSLDDRTRIEFILSDKNLYITFLLNFSNKLIDEVFIISRKKNNDDLIYIESDFQFNKNSSESYHIYYFNNEPTGGYKDDWSPQKVYFSKYSQANDTAFVRNMTGINKMAHIRDVIISLEINMEKLPLFSDIKVKQADTLVKNVADDTVRLLVKGLQTKDTDEDLQGLISFKNKVFFNGFIFYKYVFCKYRFTENELNDFFNNYIEDYILANRDFYYKKLEKEVDESYAKHIDKITKSFFEYYRGNSVIDIQDELDLLTHECDEIESLVNIDLSTFDFPDINTPESQLSDQHIPF